MTDPAAVNDVKVPDAGFMDDYDFGGVFVRPPQPKESEGGKWKYKKFIAQVPGQDKVNLKDKDGLWLKTRDGYLKALIEGIKLVESGYEFQQTHIGTGQYAKYKAGQKTGELRNASPALDYLHAHGIELKPATPAEYEEYFKATAERQFEVTLDWGAYDSDAKTNVADKWEDFPLVQAVDANTGLEYATVTEAQAAGATNIETPTDGRRLPFIEKAGKKFWARAQIKRYVSTVKE